MTRTADPLLSFRGEFPILSSTTYLISNSLGAMPRAAQRALAEYAQTWATRGVRAWSEGWWEMSVTVGDEIAPLIGASAGTVSMLPSVTVASAVLLSSLDYSGKRNRIVLIEGEFPSVRYVYDGLATRLGARVVTVPSDGGRGLRVEEEVAPADRAPPRAGRCERFHLGDAPRARAPRGTVAVDFEGALEVSRELNARDVLVDYRPGVGIRLSPHFYTDDAELDRAFGVIDEVRAGGAGQRWKSRPSLVT